jgi:transposase
MVSLTDGQKHQLIALRKIGLTVREISLFCNVPRSTISDFLNKYSDTGSVERKAGSGRPKKLSPTSERALCRTALNCRRITLSQLTENINHALKNDICEQNRDSVSMTTVRRILHEEGLYGRAAAKKLQISSVTRLIRMSWCKEKQQEDDDYWHNIVFSDETRIGFRSDGRVWVWRRSYERYAPSCTISNSTDRRSIMYWGCISYDGVGRLIRCSNRMNAEEYCATLQEACVQVLSDCNLQLMQDNAPIHRAQIVTNWLINNNVRTITWPPYSPDLNPIEEVWAHIKNKIGDKCLLRNLDELDQLVTNIWSNVSVDYIKTLYNSMSTRLRQCVKSKGYPINY